MTAKTSTKQAKRTHSHQANEHPLFPDRKGVVALYVYRIVTGARGREVPELLAGPLDPGSLTTDAQLAQFGPGLVRVVPRGAGGSVLGEPHSVMFRDPETNRVPLTRDDFAELDDGAEASNGAGVAQWERLLREQREETKRAISEMREAHKADLASFASLLDKQSEGFAAITERFMNAALAMAGAGGNANARASSVDVSILDEVRAERRELREELRAMRSKNDELAAELAKARSGSGELSDSGLLKIALEEGLPLLRAEMEKRASRRAPQLPSGASGASGGGYVIGGHELPDVDKLRDAVEKRGAEALRPGAVEVFRDLHARGMLPPAYVNALGSVLA